MVFGGDTDFWGIVCLACWGVASEVMREFVFQVLSVGGDGGSEQDVSNADNV